MSSVCDCLWDSDVLGNCIMRPRVARSIPKRGNICPNCKCPVEIGQECVDNAGLDCDGGGFFHRFHQICFGLMESFGDHVCDGGWHYPFDLAEGAEHAAANGHERFWRSWLLAYEQTWAWTPEPPDPERLPEGAMPWWTEEEIIKARHQAKEMMTFFAPGVLKFYKTEKPTSRPDCRMFEEDQ